MKLVPVYAVLISSLFDTLSVYSVFEIMKIVSVYTVFIRTLFINTLFDAVFVCTIFEIFNIYHTFGFFSVCSAFVNCFRIQSLRYRLCLSIFEILEMVFVCTVIPFRLCCLCINTLSSFLG